jgi:hypothetical protein
MAELLDQGILPSTGLPRAGLKVLGSHSSRMTTFACPAIAVTVDINNTKAANNEVKAGLCREFSRLIRYLLSRASAPDANTSLTVSAQAGQLLKDTLIVMVSLAVANVRSP